MSILLLSVLILLSTGSQAGSSGPYRKPKCSKMVEINACPLNYTPLCGTDGKTYANECDLCVQRLKTNADILIARNGGC